MLRQRLPAKAFPIRFIGKGQVFMRTAQLSCSRISSILNPEQVKGDKPWLRNNAPSVTENNSFPESDGRKQFAISFLIATVPAPVSPSLRHEFDSYVDAIQLAVGRAGYVLDSFDLPWLPAGENRQGELRISQEIDAEWADETQAKSFASKRPSGTRPPTQAKSIASKRRSRTQPPTSSAPRDALDEIAWLSRWKLNDSPPPQYLTDGTCLTKGPSLAGNPVDPCPNR